MPSVRPLEWVTLSALVSVFCFDWRGFQQYESYKKDSIATI